MAEPKLKYILEVDDKGTATVKSFAGTLDHADGKSKSLAASIAGIAGQAALAVGKIVTLGTAIVTAVAGFTIKNILSEFSTFETELTRLTNIGVEGLGAVKAEIMALPPEIGSATQLTAGYYEVLSAGIEGAAKQTDTLVNSSKLAKAAHLEQATAVKAVTAGMKAFNEDSEAVANSLMKIEQSGVTTVSQLAGVFGQVAGQASALGIGLNETSAALAAVTQMSGSTEKGATQLMAVMRVMMDPAAKLNDLFEKEGSALRAIQQIGFEGVLKRIAEQTGGTAEGLAKLKLDSEALGGIITLVSGDMKFFNSALESQAEKAGALDKAWAAYKETLGAIWETFKNTIGRQAIEIGEDLAPAIKHVVSETGEWLDKNRELISAQVSEWLSGIVEWIKKIDLSKIDFKTIAADVEEFGKKVGAVVEKVGKLIENLEKFAEWSKKVNLGAQAFDKFWSWLTDGSEEAVETAKKNVEAGVADMSKMADNIPFNIDSDPALAEIDKLENSIKDVAIEPIPIDADASAARSEVDDINALVSGMKAEMTIDGDPGPARDAVKEVKAAADSAKKEIEQNPAEIDLDITALEEKLTTAKDELKDLQELWAKQIQLGMDTSEAEKAIADLKGKISDLETAVSITADPEPAKAAAAEVKDAVDATKNEIESDSAEMDVDTAPAEDSLAALEEADKKTKITIHRNIPSVDIDVSPALSALQMLVDAHAGMMASLELKNAQAIASMKMLGVSTNWTQTQFDNARQAQKEWFSIASSSLAQQMAATGLSEDDQKTFDELKNTLTGQSLGLDSYAIGTGMTGLPDTGVFEGHAGEIVLSPSASETARKYGMGNAAAMAALVSGHSDADLAKMGSAMAGLSTTGLYYGEAGQVVFNAADSAAIRLAAMERRPAAGSIFAGGLMSGPGPVSGSGGAAFVGSYASGTDRLNPGSGNHGGRPGPVTLNYYNQPQIQASESADSRAAAGRMANVLSSRTRRVSRPGLAGSAWPE